MIGFIVRIFGSLILGLLGTVLIMQNDPDVKKALADQCTKMFEDGLDGHMTAKVSKIDLFSRTIELNDVAVRPLCPGNKDWQWNCKRFQIKISPLALLFRHVISMDLELDEISAFSKFSKDSCAISSHLEKMMSISGAAFLELKSLRLRHVTFHAQDDQEGHDINLGCNCDAKNNESAFKIVIHWLDGAIKIADRTLFTNLNGSVNCDILSLAIPFKDRISASIDCGCNMPQLSGLSQRTFVTGNFQQSTASLSIKSADDALILSPVRIKITDDGCLGGIVARVPLSYLATVAQNKPFDLELSGSCLLRAKVVYRDGDFSVKGACGIKDFNYKTTKLASMIATSFNHKQGIWSGHIQYTPRAEPMADGIWTFNQITGQGNLEIDNSGPLYLLSYPDIQIAAHTLKAQVGLNKQYQMEANIHAKVNHVRDESQDTMSAHLEADLHNMRLQGIYNEHSFEFALDFDPIIRLKSFLIKHKEQEPAIEIHARGKKCFACEGSIDVASLRPVIDHFFHTDIQGQGTFKLYGMLDKGRVLLKTKLNNGTIRIPQTYTCLTGLDALVTINPDCSEILLNSARAKLYEGSVSIKHGVACYDDAWKISYAQVPMTINRCLLNIKKDLFAVLSGNLMLTKNGDSMPLIEGVVTVDRSQMTESILTPGLRDSLSKSTQTLAGIYGVDCMCDLNLITYNPIRIKTRFVDADARCDLRIKGRLQEPALEGNLSLSSGSLMFPYKPLNITKGLITFAPRHIKDPLIEFVAKNRIKKYTVSLQVTGSASNHQIVLSSTPPLSNEQIIGLLLVGSEEESLSSMIPALVMQNVKGLFFGAEQSEILERYFAGVLKPLRYIHFVPSFSDQTGRGGLRGSIVVDIDDRWRALLQKNFNLAEDTRFELEYLLSDEISLKGGRDEHRDITGEVEVKWKF